MFLRASVTASWPAEGCHSPTRLASKEVQAPPRVGLVLGGNGNFYGTTSRGVKDDYGLR
jgi:hypothetical protein